MYRVWYWAMIDRDHNGRGEKELDRETGAGGISLCILYLALQFPLMPEGPAHSTEVEHNPQGFRRGSN
jgi:hypothetical protein